MLSQDDWPVRWWRAVKLVTAAAFCGAAGASQQARSDDEELNGLTILTL